LIPSNFPSYGRGFSLCPKSRPTSFEGEPGFPFSVVRVQTERTYVRRGTTGPAGFLGQVFLQRKSRHSLTPLGTGFSPFSSNDAFFWFFSFRLKPDLRPYLPPSRPHFTTFPSLLRSLFSLPFLKVELPRAVLFAPLAIRCDLSLLGTCPSLSTFFLSLHCPGRSRGPGREISPPNFPPLGKEPGIFAGAKAPFSGRR